MRSQRFHFIQLLLSSFNSIGTHNDQAQRFRRISLFQPLRLVSSCLIFSCTLLPDPAQNERWTRSFRLFLKFRQKGTIPQKPLDPAEMFRENPALICSSSVSCSSHRLRGVVLRTFFDLSETLQCRKPIPSFLRCDVSDFVAAELDSPARSAT